MIMVIHDVYDHDDCCRSLIQLLSAKKKIGVTSTTGMASLQFSKFGGTTIHHWAGLRDGRHSAEELANLLLYDDAYVECRTRIKQTECLIIDEIGMLSKVNILYMYYCSSYEIEIAISLH